MVAFNEAVSTYKIGAYRAALVFSYVGMGLCLRLRLLSAACPTDIPAGHWKKIQGDLSDENKWDASVFDCTQMKAPKDVFYVDDHLREEMRYWKNRRNDCAHFKSNEIGAPHVEAFWMFLESSLGRWVPKGSMDDILDRIARHFDPNLTPQGADVTPIVQMIPQAVPHGSLGSFFLQLKKMLTGRLFGPDANSIVSVFDAVFKTGHRSVADSASAFLCDDPEVLMRLLRSFPNHCAILRGDRELARRLWREMLFDGWHNDISVFAALVRHGLIPQNEIDESVSWIVDRAFGEGPRDVDNETLEKVGFWQSLYRKAIDERAMTEFSWANSKAVLIARLMERSSLNAATAGVICEVFGSQHHAWKACEELRKVLSENSLKRAEFERRATEAKVTMPSCLLQEPGTPHTGQV